jgi:hypothetical protein
MRQPANTAFLLVLLSAFCGSACLAADASTQPVNTPEVIQADPQVRVTFGDERLVLAKGLQPSMLCTKDGTLIVQAQQPRKPVPQERITYPYANDTVVSRDGGKTWTPFKFKDKNEPMLEGGIAQLRDGTIIGFDTYVTPGANPNQGIGLLYTSKDDWRSVEGPTEATFDLPNINFHASADDGGRPHAAERLHRRIIELPNGELLTTLYGHMHGDNTPSTYHPKMMKMRVMLLRSSDRARSWKLISTVAVDPAVGTEGFGEAVLCRISKGPHAGRILCFMRTGRELYEAMSDDEGATWTKARPRVFAGLDVYKTELWIEQLRKFKDFKGKPLDESNPDELRGAVVDPDLIELRSGVLVAAFGVRIPQKLCWRHPEHPWNGNYLAVSRDHGETWSHVVRLTSGVLTTHYMAIEETPTDNELFVAYDLGGWSKGMRRDVFGRPAKIDVTASPK